MEKIKIRFFINTLAGGGAEKVLMNLLRNLDPALYEITLLSVTGGVHSGSVPDYVRHQQIIRKGNCAWKRWILYHMPASVFGHLFLKGKWPIWKDFPQKCLQR